MCAKIAQYNRGSREPVTASLCHVHQRSSECIAAERRKKGGREVDMEIECICEMGIVQETSVKG